MTESLNQPPSEHEPVTPIQRVMNAWCSLNLFSLSSLQPTKHLPSCDPENVHAREVPKD